MILRAKKLKSGCLFRNDKKSLKLVADWIIYPHIHYCDGVLRVYKFKPNRFFMFKGLKGLRDARKSFFKAKMLYLNIYGND